LAATERDASGISSAFSAIPEQWTELKASSTNTRDDASSWKGISRYFQRGKDIDASFKTLARRSISRQRGMGKSTMQSLEIQSEQGEDCRCAIHGIKKS